MRKNSPMDIHETAARLACGDCSAQSLAQQCIDAEQKYSALNTFACMAPNALDDARARDAEAASGKTRGPLHGIPLVIKDNIDVRGLPTRVGSAFFHDAPPALHDAEVVARLRNAGAVIIGKGSMDELAAHVSGVTSAQGPIYNPWQQEKKLSPGGSSSGTAAAVAAGICPAGIGSDTGGSVRIPSAWCGIFGIRPTYGQTPMHGVYPRSRSLDVLGPFARSTRDVRLLLGIMAESELAHCLCAAPRPVNTLRLGILPNLQEKASQGVSEVHALVMERFSKLGVQCQALDMPLLEDPIMVETVNTIRSYEFARDIAHDAACGRLEDVHPIARADYENGTRVTPKAYAHALQQMARLAHEAEAAFDACGIDALLLPAALATAPASASPTATFAEARRLVNLFSITGMPTLTFPGGLADNGLPVGMQLVGRRLSEAVLLDLSAAYEEAHGGYIPPRA